MFRCGAPRGWLGRSHLFGCVQCVALCRELSSLLPFILQYTTISLLGSLAFRISVEAYMELEKSKCLSYAAAKRPAAAHYPSSCTTSSFMVLVYSAAADVFDNF